MIRAWVELSGENEALARAELASVLEMSGGGLSPGTSLSCHPTWVSAHLPSAEAGQWVARRLAFAHRVLEEWPERDFDDLRRRMVRLGSTVASRRFVPPRGPRAEAWHELVREYRSSGGIVDLSPGARTIFLDAEPEGGWRVIEEIGRVDRHGFETRRMHRLPFRRPVTLPPRLSRVLVNLARVRPDAHVIDPFVGTGALLAEAALVGGSVSGVDRDPRMVRGTLQNFAYLGLEAETLRVADAAETFPCPDGASWSHLVTDPPYGRASGTAREPSAQLIHRALDAWGQVISPVGRIALAVPSTVNPEIQGWKLMVQVRDRVHRSLTREFRSYVSEAAPTTQATVKLTELLEGPA
ncbi:MAG: RsmD family RNA methyltransferase [Thermoplasmata archaeon]